MWFRKKISEKHEGDLGREITVFYKPGLQPSWSKSKTGRGRVDLGHFISDKDSSDFGTAYFWEVKPGLKGAPEGYGNLKV